jgi:hypothetical protein
MKLKKHIKSVVFASAVASIAVVWWACETNKVNLGPAEPSSLSTARILEELANSRTQLEAEVAITHLFEKTGVGRPVKGSKYGDYALPDDFVSELAAEHQLFLNGEYTWTWGKMFEIQKRLSGAEWIQDVTFEDAVTRLQKEATSALKDPESPNNALLLVIFAKGVTIPEAIPVYDKTEPLSPVQEALFEVWADYAFGGPESLGKTKGKIKFTFIKVEDCDDDEVEIETDEEKVPFFNKKHKKCLKKAQKKYEKRVKKCIRKFDPTDDKFDDFEDECEDLEDCLEDALDKVKDDIEECHDQGSGN